ncbi:ankyrin repeat [Anaeramoeba flamelloides]|uniref:Ankyrin repeat n=1 Tax=Anaeramoeba flamelloides TaxID=1746091 RepID=A0ABQ8XIC0_9EUKA|nr:ankyrin repeat [Anaeramoeba flamelloides]
MISVHPDFSLSDDKGNGIFHSYCSRHNPNLETLKKLVEKGCDINYQNLQGEPVLFSALRNESFTDDLLDYMIDAGSNPNIMDTHKNTSLHIACQYKRSIRVIKYLLNKVEFVDTQNDAELTPLHSACIKNVDPNVIELLLDSGADPNKTNDYGNTPIHYCLKNVKDKNAIELCMVLATFGANLDLVNKDGNTPYQIAIKNKMYPEAFDVLVNYGETTMQKRQPLFTALKEKSEPEIIKKMIEMSPEIINQKDRFSIEVLHYAVGVDSPIETIKILLAGGADVLAKNWQGRLPYRRSKDKSVAHLLKSHTCIVSDLIGLIDSGIGSDLTIDLLDGKLNVHTPILKYRVGTKKSTFIKTLSQRTLDEAKPIVKWIYTGSMKDEERQIVFRFCDEIGIVEEIPEMTGRYSLLSSLKGLYNDDEDKDLKFITTDGFVMIHKSIVCAKSKYIAKMIKVQPEKVEFSDFLKFKISTQATSALFQYFYSSKFPKNLPFNCIEQINQVSKMLQLSKYSTLEEDLQELQN